MIITITINLFNKLFNVDEYSLENICQTVHMKHFMRIRTGLKYQNVKSQIQKDKKVHIKRAEQIMELISHHFW